MATKHVQCARRSLVSSIGLGRRKNFENRDSQKAGKYYFETDFA